MQQIIDDLAEQIIAAKSNQKTLQIRGGGTKSFYGEPISGDLSIIDTQPYSGVVSYEPSELVLTARCGTPLHEIENLLAENKQMLAFEPPRFGVNGTFGGCIASGLSGPRRMQAGPLSDFVLGTKFLNANGEALNFGGEVMKNVAGYDISRLLAGSLGALGVILQASVKVLPVPHYEKTTVLQLNEIDALNHCLAWHSQPLPISATCWYGDDDNDFLGIRLSGNESAVNQALQKIGGEIMSAPDADQFWLTIRDQRHDFFTEQPLWRISLPMGVEPLGLGASLHEYGGCVRWLAGFYDADILRAQVKQLGGTVCLFRRGGLAREITSFEKLPTNVLQIHQRLKHQFDPDGVFDIERVLGPSGGCKPCKLI